MSDKESFDQEYEREREEARAEGTDFLEREDDLPEPDLYRTASDLARLLLDAGEDLTQLKAQLGLPSEEPARWEHLDIARAASYARETHQEAFAALVTTHPWLENIAENYGYGAMGSLADKFLGHR